MSDHAHDHDFHIPAASIWPPLSCVGAGSMMISLVLFLHAAELHLPAFVGGTGAVCGLALMIFSLGKWFGMMIAESRARGFGAVPKVLDLANRYGMVFFIVSEIMFFGAFFASLFYLRSFQPVWPASNIEVMHITLPTLNTLLLLTSGVTVTLAHMALLDGRKKVALKAVTATWMLGLLFLSLQMFEYGHAVFHMNSGVYGSTFYMLTGFHGFHVLVGSLMLMVLSARMRKGDFTARQHFYFEATAWYWHFVDVVWVGLYLFVYYL